MGKPPANDNDPSASQVPSSITVTPKLARELQRIRALAQELLERAARLEDDLFTADVKKRIRATVVPTAEDVAEMAALRRKHGLQNR